MSERTPLLGVGRFPSVLPKVLWRLGVALSMGSLISRIAGCCSYYYLAAGGIIAGAFGTHGMRKRLTPDKFHAWETAAHYSVCLHS